MWSAVRFVRASFHATAVLYTGGAVAQILHLVLDFPWREMPFLMDWIIIVIGSLGVVGLSLSWRRIAFRGAWEKVVHLLIAIHLLASVVTHVWAIVVRHHEMFGAFPDGYSYFAAAYFGLFAWRQWTVRFVAAAADPRASQR